MAPYVPQPPPPGPPVLIDLNEVLNNREKQKEMLKIEIEHERRVRTLVPDEPEEAPVSLILFIFITFYY